MVDRLSRIRRAAFDPTRDRPIIVSSKTNQIDLAGAAARRCRVCAVWRPDSDQQSSGRAAQHHGKRYGTVGAPHRIGVAAFGDRTVIRGGYGMFYEAEGTSGRLNFNFLPFSLSESVNATANVVPDTHAGQLLSRRALWRVGRQHRLDPAPAGSGAWGSTSAGTLACSRHSSAASSVELNYVGTKGIESATGRAHQHSGTGAREYSDAQAVSAIRQPQHSQSGAVERVSRAAGQVPEATVGRLLVSRVVYVFQEHHHGARRQLGGNFTYDTGPSAFDIPHLLAMSFGAELPFGSGKRFLSGAGRLANAIVGGWQAQSIINYRSGLPFTPTVSRDVANTGAGGQRPNRIGSGELENPTLDAWFDKSAFVEPARLYVRKLRTETFSGPITSGMWMLRCSSGLR